MRVCCFTSFSFSYVGRALVLAETLRRAHPEWTLCAMVVDRAPAGDTLQSMLPEFDQVVGVEELGIPRWASWLFKHDLVEACTAVKGAMMVRLLQQDYDAVVYLDPDIAVFSPLAGVEAALEDCSIVLTPHQTLANRSEQALIDNELTSLRYGTYNLGFIAVRNDPVGQEFAAWWAAQLHRACYDEPETGIFTDQRYIDLVPGLFDGVRVLRDPGYNVASWNLSTREVTIHADGQIRVNGSPLRFFHFTKIEGAGEVMLRRYAASNVEVFELVAWYRRQLHRHRHHPAAARPWFFGSFANGMQISRTMRLLYRGRRDLVQYFDNPYQTAENSFFKWLVHEQPELLA